LLLNIADWKWRIGGCKGWGEAGVEGGRMVLACGRKQSVKLKLGEVRRCGMSADDARN
jgi:hypothetical protein